MEKKDSLLYLYLTCLCMDNKRYLFILWYLSQLRYWDDTLTRLNKSIQIETMHILLQIVQFYFLLQIPKTQPHKKAYYMQVLTLVPVDQCLKTIKTQILIQISHFSLSVSPLTIHTSSLGPWWWHRQLRSA